MDPLNPELADGRRSSFKIWRAVVRAPKEFDMARPKEFHMPTDQYDDGFTFDSEPVPDSEPLPVPIDAAVAAFTRSLPWPGAGTAWPSEHRSIATAHRRVAQEHQDAADLIDATSGAATLDDVARLTAELQPE
jgi:hypothetical protein